MKANSLTMERAWTAIRQLNERFWCRDFATPAFYLQLENLGFHVPESVLVNLFPDDEHDWFGEIIRQDRKVFRFDISIYGINQSLCEESTLDFQRRLKVLSVSKPWSPEVLASKLFEERIQASSR